MPEASPGKRLFSPWRLLLLRVSLGALLLLLLQLHRRVDLLLGLLHRLLALLELLLLDDGAGCGGGCHIEAARRQRRAEGRCDQNPHMNLPCYPAMVSP